MIGEFLFVAIGVTIVTWLFCMKIGTVACKAVKKICDRR